MPFQPMPRRLRVHTKNVTHRTSSIHYFPGKKKRKRFASFLYKLNPANWFNDFRDIEITLEEFSPGAKKLGATICEQGKKKALSNELSISAS